MGNRALIVFHDGEDVSPVIYLHWGGSTVKDRLAECRELMRSRSLDELMRLHSLDLPYTAARFVGLCHAADADSNLSLGLWNAPKRDGSLPLRLAAIESHGDAGVFEVDVRTWTVRNRDGHLSEHDWPAIAAGPVTIP